jgi:hypothetical protein
MTNSLSCMAISVPVLHPDIAQQQTVLPGAQDSVVSPKLELLTLYGVC